MNNSNIRGFVSYLAKFFLSLRGLFFCFLLRFHGTLSSEWGKHPLKWHEEEDSKDVRVHYVFTSVLKSYCLLSSCILIKILVQGQVKWVNRESFQKLQSAESAMNKRRHLITFSFKTCRACELCELFSFQLSERRTNVAQETIKTFHYYDSLGFMLRYPIKTCSIPSPTSMGNPICERKWKLSRKIKFSIRQTPEKHKDLLSLLVINFIVLTISLKGMKTSSRRMARGK